MAEVTQADREAAAELFDMVSGFKHPSGAAQHMLDGHGDGSPFVALLARHRTEAVKPLVEALGEDLADLLLKIGKAEWGQTHAHDAEGHAQHIADSVRETAAHFGQTEPQHMHGLYIEGTGTVICHTGTSPNSPQIARALTGAWNWLHEQAAALRSVQS